MSTEQQRLERDSGDPCADQPCVLPCRETALRVTTSCKQKIASFSCGQAQILVNGLTGLFRQLEPDRPTCFPLPNPRSVEGVAIRCDVIDPHRNNVAASQFAIDCKVEQCEVTHSPFDLQLCPNGPDVAWSERRLRPYQLPLVPGSATLQFS